MSSTANPPARARPHPAQPCPVGPVVDIDFGRQRFTELERLIGTITPKVLAQRLRQLERDGLVERTYHPEVPPRVEYQITELGRSLAPLFSTLAQWMATHLGAVAQARQDFDT